MNTEKLVNSSDNKRILQNILGNASNNGAEIDGKYGMLPLRPLFLRDIPTLYIDN